jgi:hypothetical protein
VALLTSALSTSRNESAVVAVDEVVGCWGGWWPVDAAKYKRPPPLPPPLTRVVSTLFSGIAERLSVVKAVI